MPSERVNEATRREWRELGFFYELDEGANEWLIRGSKAGLAQFANVLAAYAADPVNDFESEHDHFGPYGSLEIGTWSAPEITDHWIAGPVSALSRLAESIRHRVGSAEVGARMSFRPMFAPASPYDLVVQVEDSDFDPAKADMGCW